MSSSWSSSQILSHLSYNWNKCWRSASLWNKNPRIVISRNIFKVVLPIYPVCRPFSLAIRQFMSLYPSTCWTIYRCILWSHWINESQMQPVRTPLTLHCVDRVSHSTIIYIWIQQGWLWSKTQGDKGNVLSGRCCRRSVESSFNWKLQFGKSRLMFSARRITLAMWADLLWLLERRIW